jgi:hypothetical protein
MAMIEFEDHSEENQWAPRVFGEREKPVHGIPAGGCPNIPRRRSPVRPPAQLVRLLILVGSDLDPKKPLRNSSTGVDGTCREGYNQSVPLVADTRSLRMAVPRHPRFDRPAASSALLFYTRGQNHHVRV